MCLDQRGGESPSTCVDAPVTCLARPARCTASQPSPFLSPLRPLQALGWLIASKVTCRQPSAHCVYTATAPVSSPSPAHMPEADTAQPLHALHCHAVVAKFMLTSAKPFRQPSTMTTQSCLATKLATLWQQVVVTGSAEAGYEIRPGVAKVQYSTTIAKPPTYKGADGKERSWAPLSTALARKGPAPAEAAEDGRAFLNALEALLPTGADPARPGWSFAYGMSLPSEYSFEVRPQACAAWSSAEVVLPCPLWILRPASCRFAGSRLPTKVT